MWVHHDPPIALFNEFKGKQHGRAIRTSPVSLFPEAAKAFASMH